MNFSLDDFEIEQARKFEEEQDVLAIEIQKKQQGINPEPMYTESWEQGYPYTGAIGGVISYLITPTSIGPIIVIKHAITGNELDITNYDTF